MRTAFLGTTDFAATVLKRLAASEHRPALVVTRPDRPRGRGRRSSPPPVAEAARSLDIPVDQPEDVNADEARRRIAAAGPEAVVICAYGALIREPLLSEHEMLNVHPSLLPRWRGAAPVERAIQAGDERTGVCIMRPVAELDGGPLFARREEPIDPEDDYGSLAARLADLGADLLIEVLDDPPDPVPQSESGATYAEKVSPEERRLDPGRPAEELALTVRALNPHVGTWAEVGPNGRLGVRRAVVAPDGGPPPGVLEERDGSLLMGTVAGALSLVEVQPPGGRAMSASDYLRGHGAPHPPQSTS